MVNRLLLRERAYRWELKCLYATTNFAESEYSINNGAQFIDIVQHLLVSALVLIKWNIFLLIT